MDGTLGFATGMDAGEAAQQARQLHALSMQNNAAVGRLHNAEAGEAEMKLAEAQRYQQFQQQQRQKQTQPQAGGQSASQQPKIDPFAVMEKFAGSAANQAADEAANGFTVQADANMKKATEMMEKISAGREKQSIAQQNSIKSEIGKVDYLGRQLEVVKSFAPELRPHYFELAKKDYESKFGAIPDQIANLPYSDKLADALQARALDQKDKLHAQAEASRVKSENANRESEIKHRAILNKKAEADAEIAQMQRDAMKKNNGALGKAAIVGATGEEFLKTLDPSTAAMVKAISEGRESITSLSTKGGHREDVLKLVTQYNGDYDRAASGVRKSFKSGKDAENVTGINTALGHIGTMNDLGEALNNKDTKALNSIFNRIGTETGNANVNNFDIAKSAVANEMMRVFRQVGASETETKDWEAKFTSANSPEQLKGATKIAADLLQSRINALDDKWKRGTGSKEGFPDLLSPHSREVMSKVSGKKELSGEDSQAVAWAKANPNDPRAAKIMEHNHGF